MRKLLSVLILSIGLSIVAHAQLLMRDVGSGGVGGGTPSLSCTYTPVLTATYNVAYTGGTPAASGGTPAYVFSNTGTLPPGFTINTSTGVISGTDTVDSSGATYPGIQVSVVDSTLATANCGSSFTITVGSGSYTGPGDISTFAVWYGLRAYSSASRGSKAINLCDDTGANCADALTDGISGDLVVTSRGSNNCATSDTCTIATAYDQSSHLGCTGSTACDLSQATASKMPTLKHNCLGSKYCGVCAATSNQVLSRANIFTQASPFTQVIAANRTGNITNYNAVLGTGPTIVDIGFDHSANTLISYAGGLATITGYNDNTWHAFQAVMGGSGVGRYYVDGTANSGAYANGTNSWGGGASPTEAICGTASTTPTFTGQWAEAGMIASDNVSNFSALNSNIHTYWGF